MSTEQQNTGQSSGQPPTNSDVSFESSDVNTRTILAYLFYLALAVVATFIASIFIFRVTRSIAVGSDRLPPPAHKGVGPTMPPEPMLQGIPGHTTDPQQDMRNKVKEDVDANEKLDWVDKPGGIAQIPVDEAMKIIVSKGLPAAAAPPAAMERKK
jgi:hypothetical protein